MTASILIEGKISINAVLDSKYRKVLTLFYDIAKLKRKRDIKQAKSLKKMLESANSKGFKVEAVDHICPLSQQPVQQQHLKERDPKEIPEGTKLKTGTVVYPLDCESFLFLSSRQFTLTVPGKDSDLVSCLSKRTCFVIDSEIAPLMRKEAHGEGHHDLLHAISQARS